MAYEPKLKVIVKRTEYHGCGHFWMEVTLHWDHGSEIVAGWYD